MFVVSETERVSVLDNGRVEEKEGAASTVDDDVVSEDEGFQEEDDEEYELELELELEEEEEDDEVGCLF